MNASRDRLSLIFLDSLVTSGKLLHWLLVKKSIYAYILKVSDELAFRQQETIIYPSPYLIYSSLADRFIRRWLGNKCPCPTHD